MLDSTFDPSGSEVPCRLVMKDGRLHVRRSEDAEPIPAKIVYLRPLSARREVAFFDDDSQEILTIGSLQELAPACQELAQAALDQRYHLPQITRVESIVTVFGTHYWKVDTDKGPCEFAFKEPGKNVTQAAEAQIVLRDTIGNRYEIRSLAELDAHSRRQINKIL